MRFGAIANSARGGPRSPPHVGDRFKLTADPPSPVVKLFKLHKLYIETDCASYTNIRSTHIKKS